MRPVVLLCAASVLAGCAKTETPPPPDSAAAAAPAPKTIALSDVAGKWNVKGSRDGTDSTIVTYVLSATADSTGWTMTFPNRKPVPVRIIAVEADSIMIEAGPYESILRKGTKVSTAGTLRIQDGMLTGLTRARYATSGADTVLMVRSAGTRVP